MTADKPLATTTTASTDGAVESSQFAVDDKKLTQLMNELRSIGVDSLNLPVPVVAISGSQSAGKSSVINSIAGVTFPRASGTCTRCPMECRMITTLDGEWNCQIKIRREVDDETGQAIHSDQAEVPFGPLISDPKAVEEMLRRAQLAVLNPSVSSEKFVSLDLSNPIVPGTLLLGSKKQYSFTQNLVILEISGPSVLNLTFIDLPGIIQSAREGEDKNSPQIIKAEFENQEAPKFAKEYDPEGKRTIGLLTKPDVVRPTTFRQWLPIIRNERETLTHSWHVVKNPDVDDGSSAPTPEATRLQERKFFEDLPQHPQWKELGPGHSDRLGIPSLTSKLSQVLCLRNRESLPVIRQIILDGLAETEAKLSHFRPALEGDPTLLVLQAITNFVAECRTSLGGVPSAGRDGFAQGRNRIWKAYRGKIRSAAPIFRTVVKKDIKTAPPIEEPSFLLDAGLVEDKSKASSNALDMDLDDVRAFEQGESNGITNELAGNVPFAVKETLMLLSKGSWKNLAEVCLDDTYQLLKNFIEVIVENHFGYFRIGLFNDSVRSVVFKHLEALQRQTKETLSYFSGLEGAVFTQNEHYLASYKEKFLAEFTRQRDRVKGRNPTSLGASEMNTLRSAFAIMKISVKDSDFEGMISRMSHVADPDEFQSILEIMAEVRAYYQRVIDNIPRAIQTSLVDAFADKIQDALLVEIQPSGEGSKERCARFLQEAPDVVHKRDELLARKAKLQAAALKVLTF
ncbi:P-loop containing nucleoside triphosphate hydrolase protein [Mrakia frigida]|uniref:P-loop containing nucleoside triphosphate hydrolase protein n=1 Tax=Mrakia frigida TaxID=29902 RepID=UPI003FCC0DCA